MVFPKNSCSLRSTSNRFQVRGNEAVIHRIPMPSLFAAVLGWGILGFQPVAFSANLVSDSNFTLPELQAPNPTLLPSPETEVAFTLSLLSQVETNAIARIDTLSLPTLSQQVREESAVSLQSIITSLSRTRWIGNDEFSPASQPLRILPQASAREIYQGIYSFSRQNSLSTPSQVSSVFLASSSPVFSPAAISSFALTSRPRPVGVPAPQLSGVNPLSSFGGRRPSPVTEIPGLTTNSAVSAVSSPQRTGLALLGGSLPVAQPSAVLAPMASTELQLGLRGGQGNFIGDPEETDDSLSLSLNTRGYSLSSQVPMTNEFNIELSNNNSRSPILQPSQTLVLEMPEQTREKIKEDLEKAKEKMREQQEKFRENLQKIAEQRAEQQEKAREQREEALKRQRERLRAN